MSTPKIRRLNKQYLLPTYNAARVSRSTQLRRKKIEELKLSNLGNYIYKRSISEK